jgi:DNA polymerase-3 subunit beta
MKFTVNKEEIIEGLQKAGAIIPAKTGTAYLRSLWLKTEHDSLFVMSTNADIEFTGRYPADVLETGIIGVQGRAFVDLVRQLPPGKINITIDNNSGNLLMEQGRRVYKLPVNNAEWFQNFVVFPEENAVAWSGDFLREILERVDFCIEDSNDEGLACLHMKPVGNGRIDVCGLNGHQLALVSFLHDDLATRLPEQGILIYKKYLQDVKKWLGADDIEFNFTDKRLCLRTMDGKEMLSLPRATYAYPDYTVFIAKLSDENASLVTVDRKESMEALSRILIFNTESDRSTYMDFMKNEVQMTAQGQDTGSASESLEVTFKGDIARIAFPTRNLVDVLGHFVSAKVDLIMTSAEGPCGVRGAEDGDYTVIIMPMKILDDVYYSEEEV